jgi:intraflagellar transport protein 88
MVASCQRRIGNFQKALKIYEAIYQEYPDNLECLRFLVLLCKDMGLDYEEYAKELNRVEIENEVRGDYGYNDLKDMKNKDGDQTQNNAESINIRTENRRVQREAPKNKKDDKD